MLDYEAQRKLIIVFILATIITIIISIVVLVFIWLPEDDTEVEQQFEVGKIELPASNEEDVVQKYYKQLYIMLANGDLEAICGLVGQDYLEYFNYDKQDMIDLLREKGVVSRPMELAQYRSFMVPGYSSVYEMDLKAKNEAYSVNIVIRETSPNNYTIAFDKFIDYKQDTYTATKDSIKLDIYKQIRYTNSIQFEIKLTNGYNKNVKINSGALAYPVVLVNTQNMSRTPIMTSLATSEILMQPNDFKTFTAVFDIEDTYDFYTYNLLVIKNLQYEGLQGTSNLEYTLI